jgi:hypothetical protein
MRWRAAALLLALAAPVGASGKLHTQGVDLDTVRQLVDVYDAWGKPEKAAEWRAKLTKPAAPEPAK